MKSPTITVCALIVLALGLLSWKYSGSSPRRMQSIASISRGRQSLPPRATPATSTAPDSDSFQKSLPKLAPARIGELESRATTLVKKTDVAALDPQLPSQHFEQWFRHTMGGAGSYTYELNDCGESTGDPDTDSQRDLPLCVEARAVSEPELEQETSVILQVGTQRQGLFSQPVLRAIVQQEGEEFIDVKKLHDLAEQHPVN
jgi:hypothetical protein